METKIIREEPLFYYGGCCPEFGQVIRLYRKFLAKAEVGDTWSCEDQDRYPNRTETWSVDVVVVYKDGDGILLKFHDTNPRHEKIELIWVELVTK